MREELISTTDLQRLGTRETIWFQSGKVRGILPRWRCPAEEQSLASMEELKIKTKTILKSKFWLRSLPWIAFWYFESFFFSFYKYFAITCNISLSTMLSFIYNRSSWPPITWDCSWYLQRKRFLYKNYFKSIFRFSNLSFTKVRHLLQMKGNRALLTAFKKVLHSRHSLRHSENSFVSLAKLFWHWPISHSRLIRLNITSYKYLLSEIRTEKFEASIEIP